MRMREMRRKKKRKKLPKITLLFQPPKPRLPVSPFGTNNITTKERGTHQNAKFFHARNTSGLCKRIRSIDVTKKITPETRAVIPPRIS
jgi:hypothetical protein